MATSAIALLPLGSLLVLLLLDRTLKMRQMRSEQQGLPTERVLMELMLALQAHRGMSSAYLNGDASFRQKMRTAQEHIEQQVAGIRHQHPQLAATAETAAQWRLVREGWQALRECAQQLSVADSFARHSALIAHVLELKSHFADASGMTLDPHPASYGLLDALIAKVPATMEHVAQARGMGTGIAARGSMTFQERMRMVALSTLIRHSLAGLRQTLATAGSQRGKLQEIDDFLRLIDGSLVGSSEVRLSPEHYFAQGTRAIDAGHKLYRDIEEALAEQLQRRAAGYRLQLRLAGFCATAAALCGVYVHQWA